jgi:hypothetical protein
MHTQTTTVEIAATVTRSTQHVVKCVDAKNESSITLRPLKQVPVTNQHATDEDVMLVAEAL